MIDLLQIIASIGGVGAVFGVTMFLVYRYEHKAMEDRLTKIIEGEQRSREENTKALTELTILLKAMNGRGK